MSGLGLLFLLADDGISPDEFQCEAAAAHLSDCCPNLPVGMLYCVQGGCGSQVTPDLTEDLAQCIQQKSCDELMALGDCDVDTWVPAPPCTMPCSSKVPSCH